MRGCTGGELVFVEDANPRNLTPQFVRRRRRMLEDDDEIEEEEGGAGNNEVIF
jgi:hypothetical protein